MVVHPGETGSGFDPDSGSLTTVLTPALSSRRGGTVWRVVARFCGGIGGAL